MLRKEGFTLIEILVVLIIIGIVAAFALPNFTVPAEQARAANAQNNLLAIYSAEQNYNNNNGSYCISTTSPGPCDTISDINTALSLNIQDDGTYTYSCIGGIACQATRTSNNGYPALTVYFNQTLNLTGSGTANPQCNPGTANNWCPT